MQSTPDPDQEKRVLTAVALSVLVLWLFQSFVFEPPPQRAVVEQPVAESATERRLPRCVR